MKARLPRTHSALRRLLGGPGNAFARHQVKTTLEQHARRPGATAAAVLEAVRRAHGTRLVDAEYQQLGVALETDMPAESEGGAA